MAEIRRDRWSRYLVCPPGGGKPIGYSRVTTIAKTLDDGGGLLPWKATMAVTGLMRRPGLRAAFEALIAKSDGNPWYHSSDTKKECKRLIEQCAEAGGSSDRAEIGTALHALIEQINRGLSPIVSQATSQADVDAYQATIKAAGIIIDPDTVEATVVLDEYRVAGTADILSAQVPGYGHALMVADLKTSATLDYSWQSIAVQLAAYANANNIYIQGEDPDGGQDRRLPVPKVRCCSHGLVIHLPAGEARCELHLVDLVAGWEAFQQSMWTRGWRKRRDITKLYEFAALTEPPSVGQPVAAEPSPGSAATIIAAPPVLMPGVEQAAGLESHTASSPANTMLQQGIEATEHRRALRQSQSAIADLIAESGVQPITDLSTLGSRGATPEELAAFDEALIVDSDGNQPHIEVVEGDDVDPATVTALEARFRYLDSVDRSRIIDLAKTADAAGYPFTLKDHPTRRRWEIMRALVLWCEAGWSDRYVRTAVADTTDGATYRLLQQSVELGEILGALTIDQAQHLGVQAQAIIDGRLIPDADSDRLIPVT